ncbi:hypothetical protein [Phocaeicola oris]|uniref:hypothetical protein n=1 Tax=Phocaeicola oris TaxID=2896850 RepID=UPI00234EA583|nr:hypothetical protein [Phocaeicola oris]MCE2615323.1 hypothetical protein [Phocaeicola oris]
MELIRKTELIAQEEKISFQPVNNYFFRNDATIPESPLITTQRQFDSLFWAAAFMGKDCEPSKVDLSK